MVHVFSKIEFNDNKYKTDGTVRDENYKGRLLFPMKESVSFGTDSQSMFFFMSTRL